MTAVRTGLFLLHIPILSIRAQNQPEPASILAARLASIAAVTGYEQAMVDTLLRLLPSATRDRAGNAVLALGHGKPRRLVVCPLDEPGYVVGSVRDDGYLTLRRVPGKVPPLFDQQLEGHRVIIQGKRGPVPGVVAVRSVHLTRGRQAPSEDPFTVDEAYVDVGAATKAEVASLGVAVLAPVALMKRPHAYGDNLLAAPMTGRRTACAALLVAARDSRPDAGVLAAFVVEQELGQRGLFTLANALGPFDETLLVDGGPGVAGTIAEAADPEAAARSPALGEVRRWTLATSYFGTAVETVSLADASALRRNLGEWLGRSR